MHLNKLKYKLNIIEPWESGTESAIDAYIIKTVEKRFLLFIEFPVKVKGKNAQYFICELKNQEDYSSFENTVKGVYPINMVFDSSVTSIDSPLPPLSSYRTNFLYGELNL